jgi:hypothetical protein
MQFLYADGTDAHFMDEGSYEQIAIPEPSLEDTLRWVKPSETVDLLFIDDEPSDIQLAASVELEVTHTEPGVKGDTASGGGNKPATLETGATVNVPLFVNIGDRIKVDALGLYMARACAPRAPIADPWGSDHDTSTLAARAGCVAAVLWFGSGDAFWTDYGVEAWPAYLRCGPTAPMSSCLMLAYGGFVSLIGMPLRCSAAASTPASPAGAAWAIALAALAVALAAHNRRHAALAIGLAAGSPVAYPRARRATRGRGRCCRGRGRGARAQGAGDRRGRVLAVAVIAKQTAVPRSCLRRSRPAPEAAHRRAPAVGLPGLRRAVLLHPARTAPAPPPALFHPWQVWRPLGVPSDPPGRRPATARPRRRRGSRRSRTR